jgi:hypothetical protein
MTQKTSNLFMATAVVAAILGLSSSAAAQQHDAAFRATTLNLSAQGEVRAEPDIVTLSLGVTGEAATAQAASAQTAEKVDAVVNALLHSGVAQRDIQTQSVNLTPTYSDRSNVPRAIVAYRATTLVLVVVRDIARAGALTDLGVASGANQVQGVRFGLNDPSVAERQARDLALKALQHDAAEVAAVMGQKVVRLVSVSTQAYQGIVVTAHRIEEPMAPGTRIDPGELTIRGSANGVFELAPR